MTTTPLGSESSPDDDEPSSAEVEAFAYIVRELAPSFLRSNATLDPDDLSQEAYVAIWDALCRHKEEVRTLEGYVRTAVLNALRRAARLERRRVERLIPLADADPGGMVDDRRANPQWDDVRDLMEEAKLTEEQQLIVEWRREGMGDDFVAAALHMDVRSVQKRRSRALEAMRKVLEDLR